ncbi:MAG: DUF3971 domain-containing protein [Planctomycetaceae bacterium]|nr:DUF3971 domain-containing protein [Planctomycetaceae bacterium]
MICWGVLLLVIGAAAGGVYVLYQLNTQLNSRIINELQQSFPELNIEIRKAQLDEQKGIIIRKLVCYPPPNLLTPTQKSRPLFTADEIYLECPVSLQRLYDKKVNISRVILRNPIIRITRTENGLFDELKYLQLTTQKNNQNIPIEIINGTILYDDNTSPNTQPIKLTDVSMQITPPKITQQKSQPPLNQFNEIISEQSNDKVAAQTSGKNSDCWQFKGSIKGDFIRQINIEGYVDPKTKNWGLSGNCRQLDWTPELLDLIPQDIQKSFNSEYKQFTNTFQCRFDLGFSAVSAADSPLGLRFAIDGILSQGRAEIHEINRTLSELNTKFKITDDSIVIEKLTGLGEAARIIFSYSQQGILKKRSAFIVTNIQGLIFDTKLINGVSPLLSENLRNTVSKFEHSGSANIDAMLVWQDGKWQPKKLHLEFSELNLTYLPAPYRLDRLRGDLRINSDATMQVNLFGQSDDTLKIRINGTYHNVFIDPTGQIQIQCEDVTIDEKFMNVIPDKERNVIMSLHPTGKINTNLVLIHPPNNAPVRKYVEIGMNKINICYEKFPYPLHEITGLLRLNNDVWTFENIVAGNESARITGNGFLRPITTNENIPPIYDFQLQVQAAELPVDGQLPAALLNDSQRELLKSLQAKGKVNLSAKICYRSQNNANNDSFNLTFKTEPCAGLSIQPTRFPYRIENLRGELLYDNDTVTSKLLTGTNIAGMKISSGLMCRFDSDGKWVMRLESVDIERITVDRNLLDALPVDLKTSIESLQITQPVSLTGLIELSKDDVQKPLRSIWDTYIVLHQNRVNLGIPVQNIFGGVRLTGYSENELVRLAGEVQFDSMMVNGFQINSVHGPFFYDGSVKQLYLGLPAQKILPPPPNTTQFQYLRRSLWFTGSDRAIPIVGKLFDGTIVCDGIVAMSDGISYSINTNLVGTDVGKMAREILPGSQKISGTMNCHTQLWGTGRKMETMSGRGKIELRNANIYEAPVMLRVLRELSIKPSDPKAGTFDKSDIDYTIKGNRIFFNPISFEGSLFSLTGNGEMRIDSREVNLTMKTRLGNRRTHVPIVSDLVGWAGDQIIQLNIQGTISDPTVHRILLPAPDIRNAINDSQR